jgi:hypothetical protein
MKRNQWQTRIGVATLALSLLLGAGFVLNTTAQTQYPQYPNDRNAQDQNNRDRNNRNNRNRNRNRNDRRGDDYGNYGGSFQLRQTALNAGYNEGIKQGRKDRNKRNRDDYRNKGAYQKATQDYSSKLGDRELYRRYYQEAYARGYDAGINGY